MHPFALSLIGWYITLPVSFIILFCLHRNRKKKELKSEEEDKGILGSEMNQQILKIEEWNEEFRE